MYPKLLLDAFVSLIFDVEQILEQLSDLNYLVAKNVEEFMLYTSSLDRVLEVGITEVLY